MATNKPFVILIISIGVLQVFAQKETDEQNAILQRLKYLEKSLNHSNHELADMLGIIEEQNGTLQRQADTIQQLENRLGNLVSENEQETISFTAYLDGGGGIFRDYESILIFNEVITNEGSGYSTETGIFYCPKEGYYLFFITGKQSGFYAMYHTMVISLVINGRETLSAVATSYHGDQNLQASNAVVTHLVAGDQVWVKPEGLVEGDSKSTSFSGIRLQ